ncbi:MAG: GAF domain-containing protein [Pegethrix bostrychoides GSE-TBD4-15B]|jgi:methyl-accepting chemotaxis protein PixJ|uniref:GAF domain-containing protein n=1 Tax=Pegethrix bostrychoides GSE-TBD4-15B TaxID=2839662 RepID=A0A951PAU1_9CYAN|nr:GAF domain-containing protein [Pegethrix bostrychoides GSE-TBD4-15B]
MTTKFRESLNGQSQPEELAPYRPNLNPSAEAALTESAVSMDSWFGHLPIRRKPFLTLLATNLLTVLGLTAAGAALLLWGGRARLERQAQTELGVMQQLYALEQAQMLTSLRGQANSPALVALAKDYSAVRSASPELVQVAQKLLKAEQKAQGLDSLTLVASDGQVIASASPVDKTFNPGGLVSSVLANPRELQATELRAGQSSLPNGADLLRYSLTPVRDPETQTVLGVLVGSEPLNQSAVVNQMLTLLGGYSGIYARQSDGSFSLVASQNLGEATDITQAEFQVPLPDAGLLEAASNGLDSSQTERLQIAGQTYSAAARAMPDAKGNPVAVLVRGSSETGLNHLLKTLLGLGLGLGALILLFDLLLASLLGHSIVRPIRQLRQTTRQFAGDRRVRASVTAQDEVGELALAFNELADSVTHSERQWRDQNDSQQQATERAKLLAEVTMQIRQSLDIETILATTVAGARALLETDRVVIYRFNSDFTGGEIAAESVGDGWIKALSRTILDPLNPVSLERYRTGRISMVENLATASLSRCHCEILERLEVQANIVAPILVGEELLGLLCAHQCASPRLWLPSDVELMHQLSTQVGYAIWQADLMTQQQITVERERQLNATVFRMRETLEQQQIFNIALQETRQILATDRTVVYLFNESWEGRIVAESVDDDYLAALGEQITDPCFADKYVEKYRKGRVQATADIRQAGLTDCHIQQLEAFQIKANLVAPILVKEKLLGLLIAHQCSAPRQWQDADIRFMRQIAIQMGFALEQANLLSQEEQARQEAESLLEQRRQQQETWQKHLVDLLSHVEGAAEGDLTVRAEVTPGEIGTVADFFNAIIESLRQIVTQVKQSAMQVNSALGQNEDAIRRLADEAAQQASETTQTLASVEQMTHSIQAVADNARQAAQVARTASITAETGGMAMEMTVHNILSLRETIGDTAKKVKRLGESSQQISKVVSLINQIALQTNLLAINAGIEAARAGEDGRGFAIVAEEVGDLAARSAEATQEIEKVVATIQRETTQVVEAMEQSTLQVVEGTRLAEEAKHSLSQILEVSRQIDGLVQMISEATVSQVSTSSAVSALIQQTALVSEHTSQSSQQVAAAIQQTVAIAQELRASVETFKVES